MKRPGQTGFTIIEVLIVLALGGAMLLVVFLAVPALNRNERNTQRRHDARFISAQRVQYNIDNKTTISAGSFACSLPHTTKLFCTYLVDGLAYYDIDNITFSNSGTSAPTNIPTITSVDEVRTDTYLKCDANGKQAIAGDSARNAVVLYAVETRTGFQQQCLPSSVFPQQ